MTSRVRGARRGVAASVTISAAITLLSLAAGSPASAATVTSPGTAVPSGFRANSLSWVTPGQGWVLGEAACSSGTCTYVIRTADGGKTWQEAGQVSAPIASPSTTGGVSDVRFATRSTGWAFGPDLFRTTNGGRTWARQPIPGQGKQVLDLATGPLGTFAVVSPCAWGTGLCSTQQLTLWRSVTPSGRYWIKIPLNLPANTGAEVAVHGTTVYVLDAVPGAATESFYASTLAGLPGTFRLRPVPCDVSEDFLLAQVVPVTTTQVGLLCVGNPGIFQAEKQVYLSADTARTDRYAGATGLNGTASELAVSGTGNLAVASVSDGSFMYVNDSHGTNWTTVIADSDGGAGWNDLTYVSGSEAWVVYAPANAFPGTGELLVTHDGGRTWQRVSP